MNNIDPADGWPSVTSRPFLMAPEPTNELADAYRQLAAAWHEIASERRERITELIACIEAMRQ